MGALNRRELFATVAAAFLPRTSRMLRLNASGEGVVYYHDLTRVEAQLPGLAPCSYGVRFYSEPGAWRVETTPRRRAR